MTRNEQIRADQAMAEADEIRRMGMDFIGRLARFKVRIEGRGWEQSPVVYSARFDSAQKVNAMARKLADQYGAEIRWNWERSLQGYYVPPTNWRTLDNWRTVQGDA